MLVYRTDAYLSYRCMSIVQCDTIQGFGVADRQLRVCCTTWFRKSVGFAKLFFCFVHASTVYRLQSTKKSNMNVDVNSSIYLCAEMSSCLNVAKKHRHWLSMHETPIRVFEN
jgi:hypothetical protein